MLDVKTKQRIDNTRQVLVGVLPTPQAQIEQITTALIYKFMDDMDRENEEIGREATFLTGELAEFSWAKLMSKKLSGEKRWQLYTQATRSFAKSRQIPELFRTIFKDFYLPYHDGRTLHLFLTEINAFSYEHSEKLGDAFEYLLSISGAQADAGQFRTPRHIIDFIIEIISPQKHERILDPACGTAGFLISAYKYIIRHNSSNFNPQTTPAFSQQSTSVNDLAIQNNGYDGDKLTPDEYKILAKNIHGYDIAPEMVRLSLVNLYLHGFISPQIIPYDTLTYDTNWGDDYDVILANPPFMTPKGGIKPHNRFSITANRAEVLFVDYIAEHLTIRGRAGIIVPEGIIFQSANAYKNLRKNLVENWGLYAVISLPAGVFQPYSGVKTSILILDKKRAKNANKILFVKIENDGYDLGAQRRRIDKNDMPEAFEILKFWQNGTKKQSKLALWVQKEKIAKSDDYNLTADRYKIIENYQNQKWQMVELEDVLEERNERVKKKGIQVWSVSNSQGFVNTEEYFEKKVASENISNYKVVGENNFAYNPTRINVGSIAFNPSEKTGCVSPMYVVFRVIDDKLNPKFLFKALKSIQANKEINLRSQGAVRKQLRYKDLVQIKIPLPPLEVQQKIVAEIESYQKIIDGAKIVVENYRPHFRINPKWQVVMLDKVCNIVSGKRIFQSDYVSSGIPFYRTKEIVELSGGEEISSKLFITYKKYQNIKERYGVPQKGDILISAVGTIGVSWLVPNGNNFYFKDGNLLWIKNITKLEPLFMKYVLDSFFSKHKNQIVSGAAYNALTIIKLQKIEIPLPPLKVQQKIVAEIEAEQNSVDECKKLIKGHKQKIEGKIAEVWER